MSALLCLGEAVVDLLSQPRDDAAAGPDRLAAYFGGPAATVAVHTARAGGRVALVGAAGEDRWGHWLHTRLVAENVDASHFVLVEQRHTQMAVVDLDEHGDPRAEMLHPLLPTLPVALGPDPAAVLDQASGLLIGSDTLAGPEDRAATMRARERILSRAKPGAVILDCTLQLHRWSSRADAAASLNACVPEAVLVRANRVEAEILTGEHDPERAAVALRKAGATVVVITLGPDGVLLRGGPGLNADRPAPRVQVTSTLGAGDALTGTLAAALEQSGYYPAAAVAALDDAVVAAGAVCERWGALD